MTTTGDKMTSAADNVPHWCTDCGARIVGETVLVRETRGNLAEVCDNCAPRDNSPEYQRFMRAMGDTK